MKMLFELRPSGSRRIDTHRLIEFEATHDEAHGNTETCTSKSNQTDFKKHLKHRKLNHPLCERTLQIKLRF